MDRAWWHTGVRNLMFVLHTLTDLSLQATGVAKLDKNRPEDAKLPRATRKTAAVTSCRQSRQSVSSVSSKLFQ